MRAVVAQDGRAELRHLEPPRLGPDEVLVRVALTGICRTDVLVANGKLKAQPGRVLGHELAGRTAEGQKVTVFPWVWCGGCVNCQRGLYHGCQRAEMLGWHRDGGFAELVGVPQANLIPVPEELDWQKTAYLEPLAAALAVTEYLPPAGIAIAGDGRLAGLTRVLLEELGYRQVVVGPPFERDAFEAGIETDPDRLPELVRAVRPRGTVILKSRLPRPAGFSMLEAVTKELTFRGAYYGDFQQAVQLMLQGLAVEPLLGQVYSPEEQARLLSLDRTEKRKDFLGFDSRL